MGSSGLLITLALWRALIVRGASCPGSIQVQGHGQVSIVPTGWSTPGGSAAFDVISGNTLIPHQGARAYFTSSCTPGLYTNEQYLAMDLLGKTMKFTTDLTGAGCGCNAALYLVSMHQNTNPSQCSDYYCDANKVCGVSCAEIDIMEANQVAWHSTLHTAHDHNGMGKGYGGGDGFDGPRDWTSSQYSPGGSCIDTGKPFQVAVSFPVDAQGTLTAMEVVLTQEGKSCPLTARVSGYEGMSELTKALAAGMTPVVSYWSSNEMLWMDGKGKDGLGPCATDNAGACSDSVKFSDFSVEPIAQQATVPPVMPGGNLPPFQWPPAAQPQIVPGAVVPGAGVAPLPAPAPLPLPFPAVLPAPLPMPLPTTSAAPAQEDTCPGKLDMDGHGKVSIIPTGWKPGKGAVPIDVEAEKTLVTHMGARGYFADTCVAGVYSHEQYLAMNLLGKTLSFTTDLTGAGCGCNAAFYLVSMAQNSRPSECFDYYCDANNVCGESCAEIDIMEANQYAWHSTLHTMHDHNGLGKGYGGGADFNGPRDFSSAQYSPGGSCIDTGKPFQVSVSFPVDASGTLEAMEVKLTQDGKSCPLSVRVDGYPGMAELSAALSAGMTPVFSYWASDDMLWMDGKGADGLGPCTTDDSEACGKSVKFSDFSVADIGGGTASSLPAATPATLAPAPAPPPASSSRDCPGKVHVPGLGETAIIPTGWGSPDGPVPILVQGDKLVTTMGARGYWGDTCTAGTYSNEQYSALKLLGKTLRFTTQLKGAGCGCNAAFYLVSMRQNTRPSECHDYYCDANKVCGVSCPEIDIMEANQYAWHSTLHSAHDHNGLGKGYGGGSNFNGPRDFSAAQYGPGGSCVDTNKPFDVAVSFPDKGSLQAMEVTLSQPGHSCQLALRVDGYAGMAELQSALEAGMTPVFSYWSSNDMLWMDGKGADGQGPCATDNAAACSKQVEFYNFSLSDTSSTSAASSGGSAAVGATPAPAPAPPSASVTCPGHVNVAGHGKLSVIPTGWAAPDSMVDIVVQDNNVLLTKMGARGYFGDSCTAGKYNNEQYSALKLLGKTLRFKTDISGAGCGCNAAFYLVSMAQNTRPSECSDYYCDANKVCGVSCAEIDIMEANMHAWHSTLHTPYDHSGLGKGYGGGSGFNGPRDWSSSQYGPGGSCIDTNKPFDVAVSFPDAGAFQAMEVTLTQEGKSCPLSLRVDGYQGMGELSGALAAGMTPVFSYWSSNDMLWMDGKGADGQGPCAVDDAASCSKQVKFSDFSLSDIGAAPAPPPVASPPAGLPTTEATTPKPSASKDTCPGNLQIAGKGQTAIIPTGWGSKDGSAVIEVNGGHELVTHMGARGYFADSCNAGHYSNEPYLAMNLIGKTLRFRTDLTGAGCGCNAAFYLVSMHQNTQPSDCNDYYCDANNVCGVSCAEIDIMEANQFAWHSTLHTSHDHNGLGKGYGGGSNFNGPRDFNHAQYSPGGSCIDTNKPFDVAVTFPADAMGGAQAMEVTLTQEGKSCPLSVRVDGYPGMGELSGALKAGMTPVFSYWSSNDMLWMDGKGSDGMGPCAVDNAAACAKVIKFSNFSLTDAGQPAPGAGGPSPAPPPAAPTPAPKVPATCPGTVKLAGLGDAHVVPTGWGSKDGPAPITLQAGQLVTHMGARGYFAHQCKAGTYSNEDYIALNLLGRTLRFTTDLSGAGCGCNAAFYLVSMRQNSQPSECSDYYCDANKVCGVNCAEIDIMEANQFAWHSTLHTAHDGSGKGSGYGGGSNFNGPRDWNSQQYAPGGSCIDTGKPFEVAVSFPMEPLGGLAAMEVTLTQQGKSCPLTARVMDYPGMGELAQALLAGMTPVFSYWSSDDMLWMDGKGSDGQGPCAKDEAAACSASVKFYDFSITEIGQPAPGGGQAGSPGPAPPLYFPGQDGSTTKAPGGLFEPGGNVVPEGKEFPTTTTTVQSIADFIDSLFFPGGKNNTLAKTEMRHERCPGNIRVSGQGSVAVVPSGWTNGEDGQPVGFIGDRGLAPTMGSRTYLGRTCSNDYDHSQYLALKLLGKTFRYTVDLSGAGCGCNVGFYFVSMFQNSDRGLCGDYYCDANKVCGVSCSEIDIMEANQHAFHSTLHSPHDHEGFFKGYGGGEGFTGPRDWKSEDYSPGSKCIDTSKPFEVSATFHVDNNGDLSSMEVKLSQGSKPCHLHSHLKDYAGLSRISEALAQGVSPVVSYWSSDQMLWLDGPGLDGNGPCKVDDPKWCPKTVKIYDFSLRDIGATSTNPGACPGSFDMKGHGSVSVVPTGWDTPKGGAAFEVAHGGTLIPHMGARAYFANSCTAGKYSNTQYLALKLLGKKLSFTVNLLTAGCGCNAAFYLVSMAQNTQPSDCADYYCDANKVCGVSCEEVDIMEANEYAWHSTLHSAHDHNGKGAGYGGGDSWDGPRDWSSADYGPNGRCIQTSRPFHVEVSFPTDAQGKLTGMDVKLFQDGKPCSLSTSVADYAGLPQLTEALAKGMTPVVSYWSSDTMLWMDGKGADGQGPCAKDDAKACGGTVRFYDFAVADLDGSSPAVAAPPAPPPPPKGTCPGKFDWKGFGSTTIIPTASDAAFEVTGDTLTPHMGSRAYFGTACTPGQWSNTEYVAPNLLDKTIRFTTDLSGAGCGCNAAFYLVSMKQNTNPSSCNDYYCDANSVCDVACAEVDIMEANQHAWHSTLHSAHDHSGAGSGFGGGATWNGPRDFSAAQFSPGGQCIDTAKPFEVAVSFPTSGGTLLAMEVTLTQQGKSCPLKARVGSYEGMAEVSAALAAGMTPVVSYWSANDMLWMDGKGSDGLGPCAVDDASACAASVKFSGFTLEPMGAPAAGPAPAPAPPPAAPTTTPAPVAAATCPGRILVDGIGQPSVVPTGWGTPGFQPVDVLDADTLVAHMGARAYFADSCTAGTYNHSEYSALNLLGKRVQFTVDLAGAGCGCNAAFYLVSMRQNPKKSSCNDYYCDANKVCGVSCAEIDIMEANQFSWHSTLHTAHDNSGVGGGYGGGATWDGPRDWGSAEYGPGGRCVDTAKPFQVEVSFPTGLQSTLSSMDVKLSQVGSPCSVSASVGNYPGIAELSSALFAGMTPVVSYWASDDMLWMDGKGADGQGPCAADDAKKCAGTVKMSGFSVSRISSAPASPPPPAPKPAGPVATCPDPTTVQGLGKTAIVPTGWGAPQPGAKIDVPGGQLVPQMGARAYFAQTCQPGVYNHSQYMALNLLGRSISFTADLKGAGCGCNAAFYLVSMQQNRNPSDCHDYYCDANKVCGVSCAEIDIMEANMFAWHSTLHTAHDHNGVAGGFGGGDTYNGPRDWSGTQFAPSSSCIDTTLPFKVEASFPVNPQGQMSAMEIKLTQDGRTCSVSTRVGNYAGFGELTAAMSAGMTPVVSYWSSDQMLWMDGKGADGQGPCAQDNAKACADSIKLYDFSIQPLTGPGSYPGGPPSTTQHLYFAGEGQAGQATTSPGPSNKGGHKLFMNVADLVVRAADMQTTTTTSKILFHCHEGVENWQYGWSDLKKAACCKEVNIPCPGSGAPAAAGAGGCAAAFQQCGGTGYSGSGCCQDGCKCQSHGEFYSQCTPDGPRGTCAALESGGELTFIRKDDSDELLGAANAKQAEQVRQRIDMLDGMTMLVLGTSVCVMASLISRCRTNRASQDLASRPYSSLSAPLRQPAQKQAPTEAAPILEAGSPMPQAGSPMPARVANSPIHLDAASPCPTLPDPDSMHLSELREASSPCPLGTPSLPQLSEPASPAPGPGEQKSP